MRLTRMADADTAGAVLQADRQGAGGGLLAGPGAEALRPGDDPLANAPGSGPDRTPPADSGGAPGGPAVRRRAFGIIVP